MDKDSFVYDLVRDATFHAVGSLKGYGMTIDGRERGFIESAIEMILAQPHQQKWLTERTAD